MAIKANALKNAAKNFEMLPNTKIKVFAVATLQYICFDSEKIVNCLVH